MNRVKLCCVTLIYCIIVTGCNAYTSEKNNTFYTIDSTTEQTELFFNEIQQYANTFNQGLNLNVVKLVYDSSYHLTVDCLYTAEVSENTACNLDIRYEVKQGGIVESEFTVGKKKAVPVYDETIDPSNWSVTIPQGELFLKEQLSTRGICEFDRIVCWCYNKLWSYDIWLTPHSEQPLVVTLSMDKVISSGK